MPEQQIMWTALPRAAAADFLHLEVFVSPRLGVGATSDRYNLSDFPDFEHWTRTVATHLSFVVELADGTRHDAEVVPTALDHDAWDHLFRPSTFVRPWTFKDLSEAAIYSFPVRFVAAYLTDLYRNTGRRHRTAPPGPNDFATMVDALGPITDVRVDEEREPPPRVPVNLTVPEPHEPHEGCRAYLCRMLRPLCSFLRRLCMLLRSRLGIPSFWRTSAPTPPDPTRPKTTIPRILHPSPYQVKTPLAPAGLPALKELERQMAAHKVVLPSPLVGSMADALAARDSTFDFARVIRFYERPESEVPETTRPAAPELDFHQALGALGDYPTLLRTLGILIRLRFPRPTSKFDTVRVIPLWDGHTRASDICPATHTIVDADSFAAANRPGTELAGGLLDLRRASDRLATDAPKFDVVQMDTDGAALKTTMLAATLRRRRRLAQRGELGIDPPDSEALAALRSGGLALVRPDRAFHLRLRLLAAKDLSIPSPPEAPNDPHRLPSDLYAEDLLRGYRIEVSTDGGPWRSLCSRIGTYRLVDEAGMTVRALPTIADEGYIKATSGTRKTGDTQRLYVHETLARWTGWSLTVPRPGRTLENHVEGPPPPGEPYDRPELPKSTAKTEFRLVTSFVPQPGTLPRLRFGRSYRIRVQCVDLAGEPIAAPSADAHSDPVTYRRFEPASPATALALRPYLPGESLERLVLRSDWNIPNPDYDRIVWGATESDAIAQRTRHFFPPKTAQQMAELHGRFEMAFTGTNATAGDPDSGYRLALRESGTLADEKVIDIHTVDIDNPQATINAGEPEIVLPAAPNSPGAYAINRSNTTLPTPYLPDPLAVGAALRGLPGLTTAVTGDPLTVVQVPIGTTPEPTEPLLQIPFTGTWPDLEPLRILVAEPPEGPIPPPHWDATQRLLKVFLPKAARATVPYSSYIGPEGLDLHGVWDILDNGADDQLRVQAESGAHWMISPSRALTLVHAVQRPLTPAHFPTLVATRVGLGVTDAELTGTLNLDVASTGRIDVIGRWDEWLDDETQGVALGPREAVACSMTVRDYWPNSGAFPQPAPPGTSQRSRHEFGDTRHRRVRYLVRATSRFREYMRPGLPIEDLSRDTPADDLVEVSVLNSARPDAPRVLYAVPTFEWPSPPPATGWATHEVQRRGGSLRVYLDRPWYVSGQGELLGLVLQGQATTALPDALRTRYGADATWLGAHGHTTTNLEPGHFPNAVAAESGLSLPGAPGRPATVVAFEPRYDRSRKLWCVDIELDLEHLPWNYWPFVRMAFVRYQPESLPDAKLSSVVLGEFGQLAPARTLSLTWQDPEHVRATLRGRAPHTPSPPRAAFRVHTTPVPAGTPADELDWKHAAGHPADVDSTVFFDLSAPNDDGDGLMTWEAVVELPAPRGAERMRLEVAEYEILATDEEFGRGVSRMTYAAHIDLD
ncbi:hypothetical protein [Nocardia gipuzkoensis]